MQYFKIDTAAIQKMAKVPLAPRQRDYHEVIWVQAGSARFIIDGDEYEINASAFFVFPQGRIHQFLPNKTLQGQVLRFTPEELDDFPRLMFSKFNRISEVHINAREIVKFEWLFQLIQAEFADTPKHTPVLKRLFESVLYKLKHIKTNQMPYTDDQCTNLDIFDRFQLLLDTFILKDRSIAFYADRLNITPRKLSKTTKLVLNRSANKVINERLIIEAKKKLAYSDDSITQIAYDLGFEDNSYFTKFFKGQTNQTPKVFRSNNNGRVK